MGQEGEGRHQRWARASAIGDDAAVAFRAVICAAVLVVAGGVDRAVWLAMATVQQGRALCL